MKKLRGHEVSGLYEAMCGVVRDARTAHRDVTPSLVADDGYDSAIRDLLPFTAPIRAWLDDGYSNPTPHEQIAALLDWIMPEAVGPTREDQQ